MKNTLSIITCLNRLHKLQVNKVLNKPSACAKYAQRLLNHGPGLLIGFGNQLWVLVEGVGAVAARSAARGPVIFKLF